MGSLQLTIPVRKKAEILPAQQRLLSNLRWIERAVPSSDRWTPVAERVDALGGDARQVAPSADGQWQQARTRCRLLSSVFTLLLAALLVVGGIQIGYAVAVGGVPLVALSGCFERA